MKEEEPQVTLRRSNSKGGGSPGVDSPFQRAPRPNSQPPGSSESAQSRRSVREIRRSFEAGTSVGAAEPGNLVKQIPSARRSFHFERGPSSWETAGFGRRKLSSNGEGASACSPVPELERREDRSREFAGHSRIPIRGKEERIQAVDEACETREAKRENCQNIDNGAQQMQQRSNKSERGGTIITQQSVSFASVTVESQFTQQVSSQDANATGALRKNHLTEKPSGAESVSPYLGAHGGVEGEGRHSSQMSSPEDRGGDHSYDDGKVDRKLKKTSDISRSPNKPNGLENEDIHSQLESSSAQKDSLSLIEAAESLEKSKSQIDRLQSNLLPLSCETVNSLQSKLPYSKPSVSFVPKAMPIPKSTSAPATMTSELNSKEKNQDVPAESDTGQQSASAQNQRVLHPPTSKKANESCRAQEELDKERQRKEDMSKRIEGDPLASQTKEHSTELFMDSKSKLRAQFFETDVKTEVIKNQEQVTTLSEPTSSSSVATESCQDQAFQTISGAVTSNKSSAENATRKATPPKDLALHVTSYPSAIEQSQKIAVKPLKNGEEMISNTEWLKGTITVESTQKTYMMVDKSMTVASFKQSGNAQEQEPQSMPPTAPRVVGVEAKKGVEIPDKVSSPIHPQRQTGIPVPAERKRIPENANIKSDAAQSPDDTSKSTKSNESVPVGVSSPDAEEYRAFLLCARREERFANESEMSCTLPENGIGMRASLPPKTIDAEKHSRQKDHISACIDINANERNDNLSGSSDASKRTKNEVLEGIENGECAENGDSLEDKGSKSNKQTAGNHSAGKDIVEGEGQISSTKESPKGKKIGFMMAVLGGLKDSNKKKKSPPKEAPSQQKPKREIKKRRGRVGPPLTEEEIRELEEEAERKRKQMEERRAQEAKVRQEAIANAPIPQPTGKDGEIAEKRKSSNDFLFDLEENLLNMDEDDRSDVRRDAYADLLKKLVKAEAKKDVEGAREDSSSKKTDQGDDSDGSDTAVEEGEDGEYDYEDVVELRSKPGRRIQDRDQTTDYEWQEIEVVKPAAPVPSVRTTSLTSRSVSKSGPKSPTIMVETVSPTSTVALTSSPLTLSPGGSRTGSDSDISGPRRRTMIETAFIGSDTLSSGNYASTSSVDERQSASSRLLRTPSPQVPLGQSRIPHTSLVLEERLRRRSTSADRDKRRAVSLSPTPTDSPVNRNRGGGNSSYSGDDVTDGDVHSPEGIFEHVDRHRPLKQSMKPKEIEKKLPPKTFLQRLLGQSSPTSPVEKTAQPHSHRSGSPRRQNPPRACMAYANTATAKPPLFAQCRDPRVASLPPGVSPPPRTPAENRMRSMSPPTTPSEYQAMQMYYQRQSLEYGSGGIAPGGRRVQSPPPTLTADRATMGVRPQPVHSNTMGALYGSSQSMPGRTPDPRARSLSPHDAYGGKGGGANYFVRGAPARTTIATTGERSRISSGRSGSTSTLPVPIFKRGTILASSEDSVCSAPAAPKRVSFSSSTPTKAEREHMRMLQLREWQQRAMSTGGSMYGDDDVFSAPNKPLPPTPSAEELEEEERRWLRGAMAVGARTPMKFLEVSPTAVSESESGSEAGEVRRIMQRRRAKDDEWGADGKSRGLPGSDQPGGLPGSRGGGVVVGGGGSGDELEVRRGGRPRRDEPRRHTLSHGGDEVHHHHHHHHHHRQGGAGPNQQTISRSTDLEHNNNNAKMSDPGDAFLARMRRRVPMTSTPIAGSPTPQQQQYVRHQQRPPHPPMNSLPGYGKTPLPRGSSGGSGNYYPPGMPTTGGGTHGTLDPRSVGHGAMMMGGGGMLYEEDDPGIMSEVETASTGFRRGGKQRSSLPVVRTPSKTLERPLGLVFLQYRNETKRALLPNEITSIDTVKALFVRSFPKQLSMEYLDSPLVKIYIHDSSKDMFYELEDLRSHLRDIRDRSVLRLFESDVNGGPGGGVMPGGMVGVPVPGPSPAPVPLWDQDQSYFSEPEFDSEYHHQHIHKTKPGGQPGVVVPPGGPASSATLPRGPLLRAYSPATERIKPMPPADRMHGESGYMSSPERGRPYPPYPSPSPAVPPVGPPTGGGPPGVAPPYEDPYFGQYGATRSGSITPVIDEEASDTEMMDNSYSLYGGVKMAAGRPIAPPQSRQFPPTATMPAAAVPYDATRIRVEHMERQLANLTGLVQKALTQGRPPPGGTAGAAPTAQPGVPDGTPPGNYLQVPASRDAYRNDDTYLRSDTKPPKLGKGRDKSVSFEKSVSFSDEPPDMSSPKQHSPQHAADTKPPKPAIKSSTLPRTSSQERDHRHKPAPPPKPVSLSPGQYEGRHIYRDLHLTPEMYNQLRVLQRKAKDLRQEVRNLRRMSQAQAHSVRETIRDTFIKIRAMLLTGGESWLHQQQIADTDRVRVSREEELYKQEMLRLEKDLTELESTVEELRGNVINRKTRVNMSDVENMALILSKSSKTVADLKVRFPNLQDGMKSILSSEMEKVVREEKFLKEEPERLESALRRCKKLTGTLVTLKRLASVQEQRLPPGNSSIDARLSPTLNDSPPIPGVVNERGGSVSSSLGSPVSGSPGPNSKFLKVGRGATKP